MTGAGLSASTVQRTDTGEWVINFTLTGPGGKIFGDYTGAGFAPQAFFPLARFPRNAAGDVLVAISNDETNPAVALDPANFWKFRGEKVTQYWR